MATGSTSAGLPEALERRLLWRCRRGTKELDVLLERYAAGMLAAAEPSERAAFMRLLELPDPQLTDYLLGGFTPEAPELAALVCRIRATPARPASGPPSPPPPGPVPCSGSPDAAQASSMKGPC